MNYRTKETGIKRLITDQQIEKPSCFLLFSILDAEVAPGGRIFSVQFANLTANYQPKLSQLPQT